MPRRLWYVTWKDFYDDSGRPPALGMSTRAGHSKRAYTSVQAARREMRRLESVGRRWGRTAVVREMTVDDGLRAVLAVRED